MERWMLGVIVAVCLFVTCRSSASEYRMRTPGTSTPDLTAFVLSVGMTMPQDGVSDESGSPAHEKRRQVLSWVDVLGIILFLALIVTHFCLCRKGVYPESSCLCEPPLWLKKMRPKANRGANS